MSSPKHRNSGFRSDPLNWTWDWEDAVQGTRFYVLGSRFFQAGCDVLDNLAPIENQIL
jgi:hypothetical protein